MNTGKKINLAIFSDNKIISVKVCRSTEELEVLVKENEALGFKTQEGFYHFSPESKMMIWRSKGHSNRSKQAIKYEFEKSLIKNH